MNISVGKKGKTLWRTTKKKSAMKTAKQALRIAKGNRTYEVKKFFNQIEMTVDADPTIVYLEPSVTSGEKQTIQYIEGRIYVKQNLTSALIDDYRIDVVLDRFPSGVVIDPLSLYESATPRITALLSYDMRDRYKIVKSYSGAFEEQTSTARYHRFKVRSGLICEADGSTPNQASVMKNAYYLIFWTTASANTPIITFDLQIDSITA